MYRLTSTQLGEDRLLSYQDQVSDLFWVSMFWNNLIWN